MVIQLGVPAVVQEHPLVVVTDRVPLDPAGGADTVSGLTVKLHVIPDWVTVNVRPAIVAVPIRWVEAVFAATVTLALPLPVPFAPAVIVSQLSPLVAVHPHPLPAVTATTVVSPAAGEVRVDGEIE
jgi:hypothetical protein